MNLFIGKYTDKNFKILICAEDKNEAKELAKEYAEDLFKDSNTACAIKETTREEAKTTVFDCDYVIQDNEGSDDVVYLDELESIQV